jgi:histone deacetylase 1/2
VVIQKGIVNEAPVSQLEPVEFDFQGARITHTPAGLFGGRYPDRVRNTVLQSEANQSQLFCGYIQVQKDTLIVEPATYSDAINSPESDKWVNAMQDEMNSLKALGTWSYMVVDDKTKKKALPVKWVYKVKLSETGEIERFKARLVAKGFKQIYGVDYTEVYAPVSKHSTLRHVLSTAVERNMQVHQMDVSTAFLHGDFDEKVFIQQPEGFHVGGPNTVCRLHKALYGLKQAPRAWYVTISSFLKSAGFVISDADPSLFILQRENFETVYLLLFVDDILIVSQDLQCIDEVKSLLASKFAVKDLGEARHFWACRLPLREI